MKFFDVNWIVQLAGFARWFTSSVPRPMQVGGLLLVLCASLTEGLSITLLGPMLGLLGDASGSAGPARDSAGRLLHAIGLHLSLPVILAIFVVVVLCRSAFVRKRDIVLFDLRQRFTTTLRRRLYCAIEEANWPFIAKERLSHLVKALTADVDSVAAGTFLFLQIPATVAVATVQIAIALGISPLLTFAVIGCGGIVAILVSGRRRGAYQAGMRTKETHRATFDLISDFAASIKLAKSHNAEERHRMAFEAALARQNDSVFAVYRRAADAQLLVQVAIAVMLSAFVYAGAEFVHLSASELVVMIVVFARLTPGLMGLQQNVHSVLLMLPVFDDLRLLIARCQAAKEPLDTGGTDRLQLFDKIKFSGIRFRYDKKRGPNVLDGVELEIAAGSVVAIVGTSGAGKSTIADLLMGLQVPDAGNLTVDGQALTGPRLAAWRRSVAYIPQESFLFHQSIRANLLWSAPAASDAHLRRVLALTGADVTIATMPDGLDTMVGERGARLSGGERQRLILARALLRNPALLVLDEATSALDHESERAVWTVIERVRGNTTVIVITHRLSTLRRTDHIAVLDGGKIVQFGTWDALTNEHEGRFGDLLRGAPSRKAKG